MCFQFGHGDIYVMVCQKSRFFTIFTAKHLPFTSFNTNISDLFLRSNCPDEHHSHLLCFPQIPPTFPLWFRSKLFKYGLNLLFKIFISYYYKFLPKRIPRVDRIVTNIGISPEYERLVGAESDRIDAEEPPECWIVKPCLHVVKTSGFGSIAQMRRA